MSSLTRQIHESLIGAGMMQRAAPKPQKPIVPATREMLVIPTMEMIEPSPNGTQCNACLTNSQGKRSAGPTRRVTTFNLLYHVWPVKSNDLWRWNVEQLLKRIELFNGRRVVAIATDEETVPANEVVRAFAGHGVRFIHVQNDARLREAGTFIQLLETVKTDDPSVATFYAHAKGVSRARTVHAVEKKWAECMYHYCLDFPDRVTQALGHKAMYGVSFELEKLWIYPGTFWWFHNATLFARPDWNVLSNPVTKEGIGWSVEAFPNRFFPHDCERVYPPELRYPRDTQFGLYDPRIWSDDVRVASLNERAKWRWGHAIEREWLTWGRILAGDNIVAAVGRHARLSRARILEVGPGYGRFIEALIRKRVPFASYTGVDLSPQRSRELRVRFAEVQSPKSKVQSRRTKTLDF